MGVDPPGRASAASSSTALRVKARRQPRELHQVAYPKDLRRCPDLRQRAPTEPGAVGGIGLPGRSEVRPGRAA